jgi:hypothetical protein
VRAFTKPPDEGSATASQSAAIGPVAAGLLLDLVDFATYGPIGLWTGLAVGGLTGYFLAASLGVPPERRLTYALVAGVYCMLPFTAFLPAGTLLGALVRYREGHPEAPEEGTEEANEKPAIEAEYEAHWDEE